jgi:hypothetical protein
MLKAIKIKNFMPRYYLKRIKGANILEVMVNP